MQFFSNLWWKLVRFGFRLLYNEMAFTYDRVSWLVSLGAWRDWQQTALDYLQAPEKGYVLEIAHGTGNLQLDLQAQGYNTIGHDLSSAMGRITQGKFSKQKLSPNLTRGLAQNLPFADKTFVIVISTFPTDFIMQPATLTEVYRILKPDGRFVIVLNGVLTGGGMIRDFLEWLYRVTGQRGENQQDAASLFEGYGYNVEIVEKQCKNSLATLAILTK